MVAAVLLLFCFLGPGMADDLFSLDWPREFRWKGMVGGEEVEMVISAGDLVAAGHEIGRDADTIVSVDGYEPTGPAFEGRLHVRDWTIRWGGREIRIPRGMYTSIVLPRLDGPPEEFYGKARQSGRVWIRPSDDGTALIVGILCGYDAIHSRYVFTIGKDGRVHRFLLEEFS
jgi:hypothetical protein